jgi:hypothetical protein
MPVGVERKGETLDLGGDDERRPFDVDAQLHMRAAIAAGLCRSAQ